MGAHADAREPELMLPSLGLRDMVLGMLVALLAFVITVVLLAVLLIGLT